MVVHYCVNCVNCVRSVFSNLKTLDITALSRHLGLVVVRKLKLCKLCIKHSNFTIQILILLCKLCIMCIEKYVDFSLVNVQKGRCKICQRHEYSI